MSEAGHIETTMPPTPTIEDKETYRQAELSKKEKDKKIKLIEALKTAGVSIARIEYNGSGDEGQIYEPDFKDADEDDVDVPGELARKAKDYLEEVVDRYCGNYSDGDGGCGEVVIDVNTGEVKVDAGFNTTVIQYEYVKL